MSSPLLIRLDQSKNRLARRGVAPEEVNPVLGRRWVQYHARTAHWEPPLPERSLERLIEAVLRSGKSPPDREPDGLLSLARTLDPEGPVGFRRSPAPPLTESHEPPPPQMVKSALRRFFDWLAAASFAEMHPIVQMSLCQARLLEIQPFERPAEALIGAYSAGFALAAGFLLPLPDPASSPHFPTALEEGFQLSTGPLVQFNLEAGLRAYALADALLDGDATHPDR